MLGGSLGLAWLGWAGSWAGWAGWGLAGLEIGQAWQFKGRAGWGLALLGLARLGAGGAAGQWATLKHEVHSSQQQTTNFLLQSSLSRDSQGTVDEVKKQLELGLPGSSKGRIQLVLLMNLHLKFRNKERTKEIQDLSQSLDMTNDDSRENRREPTRQ
ncbi:hypothetical protein BY996DRAFT_6551122 [Phakopsora pachyrhizi]|uniref:Uncharacterized protein n=1 Tax=Phakopsora pachyrhizi TaxID=170000 RepID=A0AAV0BF27_PHAPC|nr:hypothetical protein BY996DRAFT_6551122 [Phakopsora pachyrhizi]CAH7683958.1 hypothetical protein PPACK8108_LOCUS17822 [Phakopsora pachyrhizi]